MAYESRNPATGELVASFDNMSKADIEAALTKAVSAHEKLKGWPMSERSAAMHRLANILDAEAEEMGALITMEMGKTLKSAVAEVKKCAMGCRYYADHAADMMADVSVDGPGSKSFKRYLPLGPIMVVMPWNYPLWQVYRFVGPALMAGNTGLLKHASNVPQCAASVEDAVRRAGFPEGAMQNLYITTDEVGDILRDARVRGATLTGSERAGASVASICGEEIKPTVLELGGSDAFIVMPSADIDRAVKVGTTARTQNTGQSCIAAKRFIVHEDVYDTFREKLAASFEALVVGDPLDAATDLGPLVSKGAREEVVSQVEAAIADGATRVMGADAVDGPGCFFRPGILEDVAEGTDAYSDEIFGPVAVLYKVESLEDAIALANDSPFGLGSSIFTAEVAEQERAINGIEAGATFVNAMTASHPALPFGGVKTSGYGRELSSEGLHAFCNVKAVSIA